ncbi:hypothetical protein M407DRAFT_29022 [Tulasnella calospora MUT 4182]|uniref:Mediator complex subunit 1 n=1 Tax=Tulasnella calospora MUT 4182 TaxID=1051891 RepID=A0A0C3QAX1_9AGAM|nr:hypothetical protein M407DRAFT_29022 [Tulasnella calospora MUT 4182]
MDLDSIEEDFVGVDVQPDEPQADARPAIPLRTSLITALSELIATFDEKYPVIPPASDLHPFSPTPPDTDVLESILRVTPMITASVASVAQANIHPRFILRTKEYTNHADAWLKSQIKVGTLFRQLPKRKPNYAADLPLEPALVPAWLLDEVMSLLKSIGMDVFREDLADRRVKFLGGGKILVVDIEFLLAPGSSSNAEESASATSSGLQLLSIKTTHGASESSASSTADERSPLDTLLYSALSSILKEAQGPSSDCLRLQNLADSFKEHAKNLMLLDGLANAEAGLGTGDRWFKETDEEAKIVVDLASREAQALASSLGSSTAPLDILLHRGHSYPVPYLTSPFLTFIVGLPPRIYLSMLKAQSAASSTLPNQNSVDISPAILGDYVFNNRSSCTLATLKLSSTTDTPNSISHLTTLLPPTFALLSDQTDYTALLSVDPLTATLPEPTHGIPQEHLDRVFPTVTEPAPESDPLKPLPVKGYVLDFGNEGVVMRREAMHRLSGGLDLGMDIDGGLGSMDGGFSNFGSPGWVDLLVDSKAIVQSPRYVSQVKATGSNPAIQHFLSPPTDPGFVLGSIRVGRMSDVWRVLEIVKEQAWLNETLRSFQWRIDSTPTKDEGEAAEVAKLLSDDEELEALIQGSNVPTSIPVQISVRGTTINYTVPLPLPDSPLLTFSVAFDSTAPKGVRVDFDIDIAAAFLEGQTSSMEKISQVVHEWKGGMEEVVRRGGASILAGWVWRKVQQRFQVI